MMKSVKGKQGFLNIFGCVLIFLFSILGSGGSVFAQLQEDVAVLEEVAGLIDSENDDFIGCPDIEFNHIGQNEVKVGQLYEYRIDAEEFETYATAPLFSIRHSLQEQVFPDDLNPNFVFEEIANYSGSSFSHEFLGTGEYLLRSDISLGNGCDFQIDKTIDAYTSILLYLGKGSDVLDLANNQPGSDNAYNLLVKEIETENIASDEKLQTYLSTFVAYFRHADRMIIDTSSQGQLFENLGRVLKVNGIEKLSTEVYVIADITQSYFRRLLARYMTVAGIEKVFVTQPQYFGSLFTSLLVGENPQQFDFLKSYSISLDTSNKVFFLSYITDYLLINGFPLGIITLVLLMPFVGLLTSIARQVVGLSVFGVFTPLLFALSMYVIGYQAALLLLLAAAVAVILTNLITRRIYLLYSPKISLMLILYCIFTLLLWRLHQALALDLVDMASYGDSFAIFPFVGILIVAKGVFSDSFLALKKGRRMTLVEFAVISCVVFFVITSDELQNIFLGNPELILLVLLLNILVGRFTGLQFMEFFRFMPLIKNYMEEE